MTAVALHWLSVVDCGMVVVLQDVSRLEIVPKTVQCTCLYNNNNNSPMVLAWWTFPVLHSTALDTPSPFHSPRILRW